MFGKKPWVSERNRKNVGEKNSMFGRTGEKHHMFGKERPKPQVELYERTKELFRDAELNYPCLNYCIDIAIPSLKIAIEYDGSYYHQDNEYDRKRQTQIEQQQWKFIRYRDWIPTVDILEKNIQERRCEHGTTIFGE